MSESEPTVEMLGAVSGQSGAYLSHVYDSEAERYFFPEPPGTRIDPESLTRAVRPDVSAMAVIDTGMLTEHPVIRARLRHSVDFTGEGPNDQNGHGTLVTLIAVAVSQETALVNIKALDRNGYGRMSWLARALEWCGENAERYNFMVVNLSAGIYHKRWGFLECNGGCHVCTAARGLRERGVVLVAAAGNDGPDKLPCPQRVGVLESGFMVVQAYDVTGQVTDYSGRGNIGAPEALFRRVPVN